MCICSLFNLMFYSPPTNLTTQLNAFCVHFNIRCVNCIWVCLYYEIVCVCVCVCGKWLFFIYFIPFCFKLCSCSSNGCWMNANISSHTTIWIEMIKWCKLLRSTIIEILIQLHFYVCSNRCVICAAYELFHCSEIYSLLENGRSCIDCGFSWSWFCTL